MRVKARSRVYALALISTALLLPALVQAAAAPDPWLRPAQVPYPPDNAPNAQRISLGRTLFFDPRLSGSGFLSCATCHNPGLGWSDGLPTGIGHDFKRLGRATPTVLNAAFQPLLMWDGRKPNLEAPWAPLSRQAR
jgi:cytochrome c peroxidase